jgi:putative transposase
VRYQAIEIHREDSPIRGLCETLEVSVSGYSAWKKRPMSQHQQEDHHLVERIQMAYTANRKVYGSPRLHAELKEQGISCSRRRVARLMREMGLTPHRPRHRTLTTHSDPAARVAANLLNRTLAASRPKEKWVADMPAIWTAEGWLYLATVLDLFSRRVVGWAMTARQDEFLGENALPMALHQRRPQAGLLHHTDRGCQDTSQQDQQVLTQFGITVSMSRRGTCYENAVSESFFGTLKREWVDRMSFQTRTQARQAIFESTEVFYNRLRRHCSPGYKSPVAYEQLMY